ncbi:hypothetical protein SMAC4_13283 [Sordaria macrospora]|uniref:uncharacterized protein n=1 Tax=Sordaria macrospora TaxID=5147 RepID=UPI002B2DBDF0|nr:hypothetical protein SMAC4_13283 [Sordaria macrospora]
MTGIVDDNGDPVKAADLLAREEARTRRATLVPAITKDTGDVELRNIINMLRNRINDLEAITPTATVVPKSTIKLNAPPKFDGTKKEDLQGFLTQARANLRFTNTVDSVQQVLYASSFLTGKALEWFQPTQADYLNNPWNEMHIETQKTFTDFEYFESSINQVFGLADKVRQAETKLNELRQTKSAASYSAEFRQLAFRVDWNDEGLKYQFYRGLKSDVKDELIKIDRKTKSLDEYMNEAIVIDNRLFERKREKGAGDSRPRAPANTGYKYQRGGNSYNNRSRSTAYGTHPGPMDVDAIDNRDNNRRGGPSKDKKCFKCDKPGHFARDCRSGGNKRQGGWKPIPTHSTNSISKSKAKGREVDNIEIDHDFANALAALVDDEPSRTICMIDFENEPTDDYMSIEEYDQYEQYERGQCDPDQSESDHEDYIHGTDIHQLDFNKENKQHRGQNPVRRSQSVPPASRMLLSDVDERDEWPLATIIRNEPEVHTDLSDVMRDSDTDTDDQMDRNEQLQSERPT